MFSFDRRGGEEGTGREKGKGRGRGGREFEGRAIRALRPQDRLRNGKPPVSALYVQEWFSRESLPRHSVCICTVPMVRF